MNSDDEYEILPHEQVEQLRMELQKFKANSNSQTGQYKGLDKLNESVSKLLALFEGVQKEVIDDFKNKKSPDSKLDELIEQNKSLAEAMVALASRIDALEKKVVEPTPFRQELAPVEPARPMPVQPPQQIPQKIYVPQGRPSQPVQPPISQQRMDNPYPDWKPRPGLSLQPQMTPQFEDDYQMPMPPPVDPNYPTASNIPGSENDFPRLNTPLDVQPSQKKKFLGLF